MLYSRHDQLLNAVITADESRVDRVHLAASCRMAFRFVGKSHPPLACPAVEGRGVSEELAGWFVVTLGCIGKSYPPQPRGP